MTGLITAARVDEVCSALTVAGAGWASVARKLPEFRRLSLGIPSGPGLHRPWVLLDGEHEDFDAVPVRLLRHENGVWAIKGAFRHEIEAKGYER